MDEEKSPQPMLMVYCEDCGVKTPLFSLEVGGRTPSLVCHDCRRKRDGYQRPDTKPYGWRERMQRMETKSEENKENK